MCRFILYKIIKRIALHCAFPPATVSFTFILCGVLTADYNFQVSVNSTPNTLSGQTSFHTLFFIIYILILDLGYSFSYSQIFYNFAFSVIFFTLLPSLSMSNK